MKVSGVLTGLYTTASAAHAAAWCVQVFNTRKMSPVFTPGAESDVPPVFVDRFGAKAWTSHTGERHSVDSHTGQQIWSKSFGHLQ